MPELDANPMLTSDSDVRATPRFGIGGLLWGDGTVHGAVKRLRERLIGMLVPAVLVLGGVTALLAVASSLAQEQSGYAAGIAALFAAFGLATLLSWRSSYNVRGLVLIVPVNLLACLVLYRMGLSGGGLILQVLVTFVAVMLLGSRAGVIVAAVNLGVLACVGVGMVHGIIAIDSELMATSARGTAWLMAGLMLTLLFGCLILGPRLLTQRLTNAIRAVERRSAQLEAAHAKLLDEVEQRQRAERARQEADHKLTGLSAILPETVYETDLTGKILTVNDAGYAMFGYTFADVERGLTALDMLAPEEHARAMQNIAAVVSGGDVGVNEYMMRRANGVQFPALVRSVVIDRDGVPSGLHGLIIDISERKRLEAEVLRAQKMDAVGTLAGGVAHDFNNLLTGIQGHASLLSAQLQPEAREQSHVVAIGRAVSSAAALTRQLLGLVRSEALDVGPTDVGCLVQDTVEMFGRTHRGLTVDLQLGAVDAVVVADAQQVEQALLNLLVNAAQAMEGTGRVRVETARVTLDETEAGGLDTGSGDYSCIRVIDQGIGMKAELIERIFEPFFTTKERGRGTGLGLATAYGIVRNHGGAIRVDSQLGEGSRFDMLLPLSLRKPAADEKLTPAPPLTGGDETILLVDDEPTVLEVTATLLERLGYNVVKAKSGLEAIDVVRQRSQSIDLVILDMIMPELGGRATFEALRDAGCAARVLVASGYSLDGEVSALLTDGADAFLAKPFSADGLSRTVRQVLDSSTA